MMTGVSVEDLQDAILCLSAEMDDMECRFRTICGAYARSEIVWTHAKKALQADVQDLKRTQTEMMQVVKRLLGRINELEVKLQPLRNDRITKNCPAYRPGRRQREIEKQAMNCQHNSTDISNANHALDKNAPIFVPFQSAPFVTGTEFGEGGPSVSESDEVQRQSSIFNECRPDV